MALHSTTGYALDNGYFTNTGVDNPPLHALKAGVDGPNGVVTYANFPLFPTSPSTQDYNYWVDVVFAAN